MKTSILISIGILVVAGLIGWRQHRSHSEVEQVHRELVARATELGLSTTVRADPEAGEAKIARREVDGGEEEAREFARQLIAFAMETKAAREGGANLDEEQARRAFEVVGRLMDLDARQMKVLIAELRDSRELDDEARQEILGFSLMILAQEQPEAALAMFEESSDLLGETQRSRHVVSQSIGRLAAEDPVAALEWIRKHGDKHSELVDDSVKRAVVGGAARQDPAMALDLIAELGLDVGQVSGSVTAAATTGEQRDRLLAALRAKDDSELTRQMLASLGQQLAHGGFDPAGEWIEATDLSEEETELLSQGLSHWGTGEDTGRWIEWVGEVRGEGGQEQVGRLMGDWTRSDYRAAGEWLSGMEAGTTRDAAVRGYVLAVAPYDPQAAAQWVDTLPQGKPRRSLAEQVVEHWKGKDEAAAAAFAESEGLE